MTSRQGTRYERIGSGYARSRREDPRLAARIGAALGDARSVVNVGAGAGSYEPRDRHVIAVEPSAGEDLAGGAWDRRHGELRGRDSFDAGLRLVVNHPAGWA